MTIGCKIYKLKDGEEIKFFYDENRIGSVTVEFMDAIFDKLNKNEKRKAVRFLQDKGQTHFYFCGRCGEPIDYGDKFCRRCGAEIVGGEL